ncbi:MAG: V-type ATP synthase subunit I [Treponema sp.]|jgi:V/A-type H+-transporting ATPase subunit I|nr:V-type ATP synthase subunit I [Treponema sp.]
MKKLTIVVMNKYRETSLKILRELGVLHLERKTVSSEHLSRLLDKKNRIDNALGLLLPYVSAKKKEENEVPAPVANPAHRRSEDHAAEFYSADAVDAENRTDLVTHILNLGEERKNLQERFAAEGRERSRIEPWGEFDPAGFAYLEGQGLKLYPYELSWKTYESLKDDVKLIVLGKEKTVVYALAAGDPIPGESPFALPGCSLSELDRSMAEIQDHLAEIERQFERLSRRKAVLEKERAENESRIEFETAASGMEKINTDDMESPLADELTVSWISGYLPTEDLGLVKRAAAEHGWAFMADDPLPDDDVPTKLKNNKLVSLINPLTGFLEVVPGYNEVDISGWFLFFFVIFFGMIFGDAFYGALILLAGIAGVIKTAKKGVPPVFKLLLLLGFSNFVWGVLTCSWFGLEIEKLPLFLQNISLPLISNAKAVQAELAGQTALAARHRGIVQQNLMIFCFSLALLQLSIGHILAIIRVKSLKALGDIGSMAMLAGMYFIVLSLIASNEYRRIPLVMPAVYVFAGGFLLNFLFANYGGSFGRSVLESCKNFISVVLGIANVFSDIMSYIRLWAVGLAGAAIASTVDTMAGPMLGHFILFIFGIILLVFGHGLNLVLNVLSVLVHAVRLNTLEFSGHAGLTWAGHAYKPFAKK